jgi:hypothetical protein
VSDLERRAGAYAFEQLDTNASEQWRLEVRDAWLAGHAAAGDDTSESSSAPEPIGYVCEALHTFKSAPTIETGENRPIRDVVQRCTHASGDSPCGAKAYPIGGYAAVNKYVDAFYGWRLQLEPDNVRS